MNFIEGLIGLCIGMIFAFVVSIPAYENSKLYVAAQVACEVELPRSQKCIITAVPEEAE